jgi:hypothetical protein
MLGACTIVAVAFVALWMNYTATANHIALPPALVSFIAASYLPVVTTTILGFRNYIFEQVVRVDAKPVRRLNITSGAITLYCVALCGPAFAFYALFRVSLGGLELSTSKLLLGSAAGLWAATIGATFDRFFKQYTVNVAQRAEDSVLPVSKAE